MYLYETHMHTKEGSRCSQTPAAEMVDELAKRGYSGVVVTDHFFSSSSYTVNRSLPWKKQMPEFYKSFQAAYTEGQNVGVDVFFGFELAMISYDIIVYGLSIDWLSTHPDFERFSPETIMNDAKKYGKSTDEALADAFVDLKNTVHEAGGYLVSVHPCRDRDIPIDIFVKNNVDGIELYNGSYTHNHYPKNVYAAAKAYSLNLQSGSDAHSPDRLNNGVWFEEKPKDIYNFIDLLRKKPLMKAYQSENKISPDNPEMVG